MDYFKLSKEVSYALRHASWEYKLELDDNGRVNINQLITSFNDSEDWNGLNEHDLYEMIERSEKAS